MSRITEALIALTQHPEVITIAPEIYQLVEEVGQINVMPDNGTRLICATCFSVNAPGYRLRRSAGKYIAYCVDETGGCAAKEIHPTCSFKDHLGIECPQLAEFQIMYGEDELITRYACTIHAGVLMKDSKNTVYPIR